MLMTSLLGVADRWSQLYSLVHNSSHLHSGFCWSMVHESMFERATGVHMCSHVRGCVSGGCQTVPVKCEQHGWPKPLSHLLCVRDLHAYPALNYRWGSVDTKIGAA